MHTDKAAGRPELAKRDVAHRPAAGIVRGAALIAGLTVLARLLGLVRTLVFSQTVGATCLGTVYLSANQVPNLIYELALGGALTSAMVPVLAARPSSPDRTRNRKRGSARSRRPW